MNNFATTDSVAGVGRNVNKHSILNNIFHLCWYSVFLDSAHYERVQMTAQQT